MCVTDCHDMTLAVKVELSPNTTNHSTQDLECGANGSVNPLPDDKNLDRFKLNQSADNNFEFDENSRKFSKRVENTVGKGEIACYEQFLLFPQCFQKARFPGASKDVIVWEWVNVDYPPCI